MLHVRDDNELKIGQHKVGMRIGYIGLGAMGRELAIHVARSHDLSVYDLDPAAVARLEAEGAEGCASLQEIAGECEVILLCLPKSDDVERVLFGERGLASTLKPGAIVIDQTSGQPGQTRSFAERLHRQGVCMIDAPVSGGVPAAQAGLVTIMASGAREDFERVQPLLKVMTGNVFYCGGGVGDGQALKAINNTVNTANRLATLEIAAVGRRLGLSTEAMAEAFNAGHASNYITEKMLPAIVAGQPATDFAMALMVKDLDQAADLASAHAVPMPISETARGLLCAANRMIGDDARLEDIVPFMEQMTATSFVGECASRADEVGLSAKAAMDLVCGALAACNRMTIAENVAFMQRMEMSVADVTPAIMSGSARSAAAADLLDPARPSGDEWMHEAMVQGLSRLARVGKRFGIPMLMANQARSQCLLTLDRLALDAAAANL